MTYDQLVDKAAKESGFTRGYDPAGGDLEDGNWRGSLMRYSLALLRLYLAERQEPATAQQDRQVIRTTPYYVHERFVDRVLEVGFATHGEVMDYLAREVLAGAKGKE